MKQYYLKNNEWYYLTVRGWSWEFTPHKGLAVVWPQNTFSEKGGRAWAKKQNKPVRKEIKK